MARKAKRGDATGIAAIRIWAMAIEAAMIKLPHRKRADPGTDQGDRLKKTAQDVRRSSP